MPGLLKSVPPTKTLVLAGETIARFVEPHGTHPVAASLNGFGPPVWFCGATANLAANVARLYPGVTARLVSHAVDDTFGRQLRALAGMYGIDTSQLQLVESGAGGTFITPLYRMPLAVGPDEAQRAEMFSRAHGPVAHWYPGSLDFDAMLKKAGGVFLDGIFVALSNLTGRHDNGPAGVANRLFERAAERGMIRFFDTNRRASLWTARPGIRDTAHLYSQFASWATVLSGSVGLLLPLVNRDDDFAANNFGKRCLDGLSSTGRSTLLDDLLGEVFRVFPSLELIGVTIREEITPARHRVACAVAPREGRVACSPVLDVTIIDRPGMGDAAAAVLVGACMDGETDPSLVAKRMVAAFAFAGMTVGDIPPFSSPADLDRLIPTGLVREVDR